MINIFEHTIVKNELNRLHTLIGTDGERNVQFDIAILNTALNKIDAFLNGSELYVIINGNMWEECHDSLWQILKELNLEIDDEKSNYVYYEFAIKRRVI